jgi:hypothetical protein
MMKVMMKHFEPLGRHGIDTDRAGRMSDIAAFGRNLDRGGRHREKEF